MALQAKTLFDDSSSNDKIMKREAVRFVKRLKRALLAENEVVVSAEEPATAVSQGASAGSFADSFVRAQRFHAAWARTDKPQTVDFLLSSVVALKAKQRERGLPESPPEETFAQIKLLGGEEAEAEARRRYEGSWQAVRARDLATSVSEIAQRAYWDAVSERVRGGEMAPLFDVLGELQKAMRALVAHSPARVEELEDRFDAKWIEQQVSHGALDLPTVHGLMRFVAGTILDWQAPADAAETREWLASVERTIGATGGAPLETFISEHLVDFLRVAIERVGCVYRRTLELQQALEQRKKELEAEAEAGELAQQD